MTTFSTRSDCVINSFSAAIPDAGDGELFHPLRHIQKAVASLGRRGSAPFASASSALAPQPHLPGGIRERAVTLEGRTGTEFPVTVCHVSKKDCPGLIGTGVRSKKVMGMKHIDVYALGFYVDTHAAKRELGKDFGCLPPASLERNQALAERLKEADSVEKSVRIVITSGLVNQPRFSKALRESLEPRVKQTVDGEAALDEFEGLFRGARFHKGFEMVFTNTKAGGLALRIDGKDVGQVASPAFTRAFFDMYLGTDPVSKDGKASIAKGLARTISRAGA